MFLSGPNQFLPGFIRCQAMGGIKRVSKHLDHGRHFILYPFSNLFTSLSQRKRLIINLCLQPLKKLNKLTEMTYSFTEINPTNPPDGRSGKNDKQGPANLQSALASSRKGWVIKSFLVFPSQTPSRVPVPSLLLKMITRSNNPLLQILLKPGLADKSSRRQAWAVEIKP